VLANLALGPSILVRLNKAHVAQQLTPQQPDPGHAWCIPASPHLRFTTPCSALHQFSPKTPLQSLLPQHPSIVSILSAIRRHMVSSSSLLVFAIGQFNNHRWSIIISRNRTTPTSSFALSPFLYSSLSPPPLLLAPLLSFIVLYFYYVFVLILYFESFSRNILKVPLRCFLLLLLLKMPGMTVWVLAVGEFAWARCAL